MSVHKHGTTGPGCAGTCCLKATDLGVSFGGEEVLRDVSFHLHCGEIVALIGPNGAGKSSLFRTILGQVPHTGTIEFQRAGGDKTRPLIGYVPQSPSFDRGDPVSVFDFFSAAISRYPVFLPSPRSLRARVGACLARVHGERPLPPPHWPAHTYRRCTSSQAWWSYRPDRAYITEGKSTGSTCSNRGRWCPPPGPSRRSSPAYGAGG